MAYAFAKEVSSDFLQSVQIVTGLSLEHVQDLAGVVIGWLSHTGRIDFKGDVAMLAQSLSLPEGVVREATTMLRVFFRGAIRSHLNAAQVRDDLVALGLEADVVDVIVALWETHKSALTAAVVATSVSVNELVDMDWKFGVTASSSELKQVGKSFLQLRMTLNRGGIDESVYMELTLEQFYAFISDMENAAAALENVL